MAGPDDVVLSAEDSGLPRPRIAELWNMRPVLVRNLAVRHSALSQTGLRKLVSVHDARFSEVAIDPDWVGEELQGEEDPRYGFRRREIDRFAFLSEPVDALLASLRAQEEPEPAAIWCAWWNNSIVSLTEMKSVAHSAPWRTWFLVVPRVSYLPEFTSFARGAPESEISARARIIGSLEWVDWESRDFELVDVSVVEDSLSLTALLSASYRDWPRGRTNSFLTFTGEHPALPGPHNPYERAAP